MMTVVAIMLGLLPSCRAPDRLRNHAAEAMLMIGGISPSTRLPLILISAISAWRSG
jgi:Cu/Ag efflux pump CusA